MFDVEHSKHVSAVEDVGLDCIDAFYRGVDERGIPP